MASGMAGLVSSSHQISSCMALSGASAFLTFKLLFGAIRNTKRIAVIQLSYTTSWIVNTTCTGCYIQPQACSSHLYKSLYLICTMYIASPYMLLPLQSKISFILCGAIFFIFIFIFFIFFIFIFYLFFLFSLFIFYFIYIYIFFVCVCVCMCVCVCVAG